MAAIPGARLSAGLLRLMLTQSMTGLLLPGQYRDVDWITVTWAGNDWVTLFVGVPLLLGRHRNRVVCLPKIRHPLRRIPHRKSPTT
jgi:hypothetical protein